ncbi:VanZ family protein [Alkalibacter saccharofermentans]|uniref:Glycopeptide antibiotics resistance protein n=1 Tax=Alkalibacter saccharofermentans DSM 14828 TaxID=1120975 RepID=A0A1M4ZFP2_9FIRM|nr:VanZ family protein [Alkalibacter saccharofermentans]SHF16874.1 Glycopeptide antibiotics resistance protein [Alkalibacter saccharofermentans DSM 14828]
MRHMWQQFSAFVPFFLIAVGAIVVLSFMKIKKGDERTKIIFADALLLLTVAGIFLVTLVPLGYRSGAERMISLVPLSEIYDMLFQRESIEVFIWNVGINLMLFVPFGFFLSLRTDYKYREVSPLRVAAIGLMLSFFIETFQFVFPMGRMADIDDLIVNTLGAYLGYVLWRKLSMIR